MSAVTTKKTLSAAGQSETWQKQPDVYTQNDVIEAYVKGKEAGRNEYEKAMKNLFDSNLEKAKSTSEEVFNAAHSLGIKVYTVLLKADLVTNFFALVIADKDDYASEDFLKLIRAARECKSRVDKDDFTINFTYTYKASTLNESCFGHEGYFLKYGR